jgi:hypothetical protein
MENLYCAVGFVMSAYYTFYFYKQLICEKRAIELPKLIRIVVILFTFELGICSLLIFYCTTYEFWKHLI